ncbi:MAG: type II toxin-antitoxin system RelB/DinJ family antitoxin [Clostridiales bacterium]|jgi:antitoxin component of RelBE/YafQ-DinJ toxin-antitoxin module|nr:type II toxin-antitoxin system RelB/DinJ family antitoxin [Clostridiales bacterium]
MGKIITVRVDEELKEEFEDFCRNVGSNTSVILNMFVNHPIAKARGLAISPD